MAAFSNFWFFIYLICVLTCLNSRDDVAFGNQGGGDMPGGHRGEWWMAEEDCRGGDESSFVIGSKMSFVIRLSLNFGSGHHITSTAMAVLAVGIVPKQLHTIPCAAILPLQLSIACLPCRHYVNRRSRRAFIIALLLIAGVESNPGPERSMLSCGLLNVRSAVKKSALIHDLIDSNSLDMLITTETWITSDSPAAVKNDIAPNGYKVLHAHRKGKKVRGGGIAVIYRSHLKVTALQVATSFTSFEQLSVKITAGKQRINLISIYRPPPFPSSKFFDELRDLLEDIETLPGHAVFCGDFNCPGSASVSIDSRLMDVINSYNYQQHICETTRQSKTQDGGNILDLLLSRCDSSIISSDITVTDVGFSDHSLVRFSLAAHREQTPTRTFSYRNLKSVDSVV